MERQMSDAMQGPVVTVAGGALEGRTSGGVTAFLGVPYAAAPFGENRMRPPQPAGPWSGTRLATGYGPTVPKGDYPPQYQPLFPEVVIAGEECLNLNVWTPDPGAAGLPVLVWIHGGSFMNGSGSVGEYDLRVRPRRRRVRDDQLPAVGRGLPVPRRRRREPRPAGPGRRAALGAGQYRGVRRRPGASHRRRRVRGSHEHHHPAVHADDGGAVRPGDRPE